MSTIENKYKAAVILLSTMREAANGGTPEMALKHRELFDKATANDLEVREAGYEVVLELIQQSMKETN